VDAIAEQLVSRLETDPNDTQAYEALKAHYREVHDPASLTNLVAGWAAYQSDPHKASRGYYEAAQVVATVAPQHERRVELLRKAVEHDVVYRDAVLALAELLEKYRDDQALAEFLDQHLRSMEKQKLETRAAGLRADEAHEAHPANEAHDFMAVLYTRLAKLWASRFDRADVARHCFERALDLDAANADVIAEAQALARVTQDAVLLARALGAQAEVETETARKCELYRAQAAALAQEPADFNGAIQALRAAHNLAPDDVATMRELAAMLARRAEQGRPEAAGRDLRRSAELHYLVAQVAPPAEALGSLQAALNALPHHDGALHLLEQHAAELGRDDLLPEYWRKYVAHAAEGPELDQRRVSLARFFDREGKLDDAIGLLEQLQTPGMAGSLLTELKVRRGPRSQRPRVNTATATGSHVPSAAPEVAANGTSLSLPLQSSQRPLDAERQLRELRRALRNAIASGHGDDVVQRCLELREIDPGDAEAFALLETHYRKQADHAKLRELLWQSAQASGAATQLSEAERKRRLREVANLSEAKLNDIATALEVSRAVVELDSTCREAAGHLKRLLQRTQRWDELARVLDEQVHHTDDPTEKSTLLAQLVSVQLDRRGDVPEALEALRQLHTAQPSASTRDKLCELLLQAEAYTEAVPLLWRRAEQAEGEREKLRIFRHLAELFETKLQDREAAFDVCLRILELRPKDTAALERMQHVDESSGNAVRLLSTLERRAQLMLRANRAQLLLEMAKIAESALDDLERAGDYYRRALELEPSRVEALDALCELFTTRERYVELVDHLKQMASIERDPNRRVELCLRQARLLCGPLSEPMQAASAYRDVLEYREDEEALTFLLSAAREEQDWEATAGFCARLAEQLEDLSAARGLMYERAQVLVTELGRPRDAIATLRNLLTNLDPNYEPAIEWLAELAGNLGDIEGLALALTRRLDMSTSRDARVALAKRLADLQEHDLTDQDQAILALTAWAKADPEDPQPQRRLRRLLEENGRFAELVATCDALAQLEPDMHVRDEATLAAAQISFSELRHIDGAWSRLLPLLLRGQPNAIQLLLAIARQTHRCGELAALCVRAAQEAPTIDLQGQLWAHTARIFRDELSDPHRAFEAALRLLATNLKNRDALTQVEESAAQAGQWARLVPVYDRLLKAAGNDNERIELLLRHADLLEQRADNLSAALDRVLQASALASNDEALLARAEQLATQSGRGEQLLGLCDQQAARTELPSVQVEWLLRAARFAMSASDSTAANAYLEAALAATRADVALWELCISLAQQLDAQSKGGPPNASLRALVAAHRRVAENSPPAIGATLMLRASRLLDDRLDDERGAFDALRAGSGLFPLDENLYENLLERAEAKNRLDALDAHLARGVEDALDARTAACLLARRARLLEAQLGRPDEAANVYVKLLQLRPDDLQATTKLRESLRRARRFQDLLVVIHKQSQRSKRQDEKLELLKESAHVWELDLKNRWEAVDCWRKVLEIAPDDPEALRALARLDRRSLPPRSQPPAARPSTLEPPAPVMTPAPLDIHADVTIQDVTIHELSSAELDIVDETSTPITVARPTPPPPPPAILQRIVERARSVNPPPSASTKPDAPRPSAPPRKL
jgi:tetratricopeptide (TPR) repeat protein